ncbi:CinA family protein [Roseomonas sp. PWR1]|uniref:CinA family protein n=1 Tax=Roseomonas nitratireducens TaxID=2820810 RepID=A0ABS4AWR8_9PROT|nr:CinA family protein [Neoroseomonas nitratireducens]MBP0465221.1 CinA family protein [Neoroseomonas nitratireducens]
MDSILPAARRLGECLRNRKATIAVAESSVGGLMSAALLSQPGASAYFLGGAVVYTAAARQGLLGIGPAEMEGIRSASEPYALLMARTVRQRLGADWGLAETGAAGPAGNRYGDPAGHACLAIAGPVERVITLRTGSADRAGNMRAFALALFALAEEAIG